MSRELLQQALHHLVDLADDLRRIPSDITQTISALEAELAKPEQEPVAWLHPDKKVDVVVLTSLAWFDKPIPLFTASPRKPWQGLTGTEINHIFAANVGYPERMCRAIEAKLKEKNT